MEPGFPGPDGAFGVRTRTADDVRLLKARGKLRRVERQWERLEDASCSPRRGDCPRLVFGRARGECFGNGRVDSLRGTGEAVHANHGFGCGRSNQVEPAGADNPQLGEPHDRFQGATNLRRARWSKPSQSGGTTRAERVRKVAAPGRKRLRAAKVASSEAANVAALRSSGTAGSGRQAQMPMEGRIYDNPMRGAQVQEDGRKHAERRAESDGRTNGQRKPDCVSEGEAKVTRAGPLVDPTPWRARARSPL
jgi:hypothetical protein